MNKLSIDNLPKDGAKELASHLKSSDFFEVEKHPFSQFELTEISPL